MQQSMVHLFSDKKGLIILIAKLELRNDSKVNGCMLNEKSVSVVTDCQSRKMRFVPLLFEICHGIDRME